LSRGEDLLKEKVSSPEILSALEKPGNSGKSGIVSVSERVSSDSLVD